MSDAKERSIAYWVAVARMGFENDFNRISDDLKIQRADLAARMGTSAAYVSKVLNGTAGNFQLSTMVKWARAIGAIVQVRLIKEGKEVVRVLDYETAGALDDEHLSLQETENMTEECQFPGRSNLLKFKTRTKSSGPVEDEARSHG